LTRLSRDIQAALTFLGAQPEVHAARLGIYGTSYGGATVVFVAAVDPRVKCVVSVVGVGNGARWMRSVRRPDEYHDLLTRAAADRDKRVLSGVSDHADRNEVLLPDRQSAELGAAALNLPVSSCKKTRSSPQALHQSNSVNSCPYRG
jgi:hypothetical protein